MRIRERVGESAFVLELSGRWVLGEADARLADVVQAWLDDGRRTIVLDCAALSTVDSSGLGDLVESYVAVSARGGRLELAGVTARFRRLLSTVGLLTVLPVRDAADLATPSGGTADGTRLPGPTGDTFTPACRAAGWGQSACATC